MSIVQQNVLELMRRPGYEPLTGQELSDALGLPDTDRVELEAALELMLQQGKIILNRSRCYGLPEKMDMVAGELQMKEDGYGFVLPDQVGAPDVRVSSNDLAGAMHKDRVVVRVERRDRDRLSGRIVRILDRFHTRLLGAYRAGGPSYGFVKPSDARIPYEFYIPAGLELDAREGQVVEVEVVEHPTATKGPVGKVTRVLGLPGDKGIDTESVIREYGLIEEFPPEALLEAEALPDSVRPEDLQNRRDLRGLLTFTIDPATARDYDDAISIEHEDGLIVLGVHIADVGHYVRPGTALDREACRRSTSVYFPERVLPMLPEKLSSGLCSLKAGVDRLAMTCRMHFTKAGERVRGEVFPSVIHSRFRMSYEQIQCLLEGRDLKLEEAHRELMPVVEEFAQLGKAMRQQRQKRGSLLFMMPETRIVLDDRGRMTDIRKEVSDQSHQIIEEAMLAANETVAEEGVRLRKPFLYRIHEKPRPEKVQTLGLLARALELPFKHMSAPTPRAYQAILKRVQGKPEEMLVTTTLLQTLKQARYHIENAGHFGIGAKAYTHFTSPIRRYPDLMVHRFLKHYHGEDPLPRDYFRGMTGTLERMALEASRRERIAEEAEREIIAWKKVQFMASRVGEIYDGVVTGVAPFGLFVEIQPYFVEGLIHVSSLGPQYYHYDPEKFRLEARGSGEGYRIGDRLTVQVLRVNEVRRQVDFVVQGAKEPARPTTNGARPTAGRGRSRPEPQSLPQRGRRPGPATVSGRPGEHRGRGRRKPR